MEFPPSSPFRGADDAAPTRPRRTPGRQRAAWSFARKELLAYLKQGVLLPSGLVSDRPPAKPSTRRDSSSDGEPPTVILVPGYGGGRGAFLPLEHKLSLAGFGRQFAFGYLTLGRHFDQLVDELAEFCARKVPTGHLVFVAHSLGGLLVRALLQRPGLLPRTQAFVSISSPQQGLRGPALLRRLPVIGECLEHSALIAGLRAHDARLGTLPMLSLVSRHDHLVSPSRAAAFGSAQLEVFDQVGHVGALFDPKVQGRVLSFLDEHTPQRLK